MPDDSNALMPLPRPRQPGAMRATLALIFSLASFVLGIYAVVAQQNVEPRTVVPLENANVGDALLQSRVLAQEGANASLSEEVNKLRGEVEKLAATSLAPVAAEPAQNTVALQAKLDEINKLADGLQKKMQETPAVQAKIFTIFSTLETIRRRMTDGAGFDDQLTVLTQLMPNNSGQLAVLKDFEATPVADAALLKEWKRLSTDLSARDQMAGATEITDKIAIQMHKLVTIHPKGEAVAVPPATAGLDKSLREQRWQQAVQQAESVNAEGVPDYAAWLQKLRARANAEKALTALHDAVMPALPVAPAAAPLPQPAQ